MHNKNRPNIQLFLFIIFISTSLHVVLVIARGDPLASPEPDPRYNSNNTRSDSSLMVMLAILFIGFCVVFTISLCILQCSDYPSSSEAREAFADQLPAAKANHRGLQQSEIDLLPKFLYSEVKQLKIGTRALECAVCLTEFEEVETLRLLPICNHVFHAECIDFWLVGHVTCPVCRANLLLDIPESSHEEVGESTLNCQHHVEVTIEEPEKKKKLPRPHSTGHLMVRPGRDDLERFTLRLPNEVRVRILAVQPKRTANLEGVSSSLRGYRSEGSGSSRYDRFMGRAGRQYKWSLPL